MIAKPWQPNFAKIGKNAHKKWPSLQLFANINAMFDSYYMLCKWLTPWFQWCIFALHGACISE